MYMKVLSIGFNNQCITFDRSAKNTIFCGIEYVEFRIKKEHLWEALLFCFHLKKSAAEDHRLLEAYGEHALSETTCRYLEDSKTTILT